MHNAAGLRFECLQQFGNLCLKAIAEVLNFKDGHVHTIPPCALGRAFKKLLLGDDFKIGCQLGSI